MTATQREFNYYKKNTMLKLLRLIILFLIACFEYWFRILYAIIDWDTSVLVKGSLFDKLMLEEE